MPRWLLFALLTAACLVVAVGYVVWAATRQEPGSAAAAARLAQRSAQTAGTTVPTARSDSVIFRSTALGETYGQLAQAPLSAPATSEAVPSLACDRVHMAAGQGLCLTADRGVFTTYQAALFGPDFAVRAVFPLSGIPSRTRIAPDGRLGAITVFVSGHSYAAGNFSTQTTLLDLTTGAVLEKDLEQFTVVRDGVRIQAPDFNFWGVTFARDSNRFYATLGTAGTTYLVEGDVAARQMRVVYEGVECPSLSPDNTRVAFKKRVNRDGHVQWQPAVLDLATLRETTLAETRTVDDQIEWLDDARVLYALPAEGATATAVTNVWVLPADGSGEPRLLLPEAESPAVVR